MELNQLKYFVTIAESQGFTKAAEVLHISQPALSYQMKRLEEELGTRLFDRGSRRVHCTPDGELFLPLAQAVLVRADEAMRVMREHMGMEAGEVFVGTNPSFGIYVMPQILLSFRKHFPRVRVNVLEAGDSELQRMVTDGQADFAVITAPGAVESLEMTLLFTEDVLAVLPPFHPLAGRESVALHELAYENFVLTTYSSNVVNDVTEACRRAGFEPRVPYKAGSLEGIRRFILGGLGVAVLPRMALIGAETEGLAILPLAEKLTRSISLIQSKDRSIPAAARALFLHVRNSLVNWPPQS